MGTSPSVYFTFAALLLPALAAAAPAPAPADAIRGIYDEALVRGTAYQNLTQLVERYPGRLSGSKKLEGAIAWATGVLQSMHVDKVWNQPVMVPQLELGAAAVASLVWLVDNQGL